MRDGTRLHHGVPPAHELRRLLDEQAAYYRAAAPEYENQGQQMAVATS
jgi:hypothetical protein